MSDFKTFSGHFPQEMSKSLVNFGTNVALKKSRYIFTYRVGKRQMGYCTHCQNDFPTSNLKHQDKKKCPKCRSHCNVRSAGMGRKYMEDKAAFVWYERSKINPQAITARVLKVYRDYSGDYRTVKTTYNCCHMFLFEPGNSEYYELGWGDKWKKHSSVFSVFDRHLSNNGFLGSHWNKFMSESNIKRAVKGTPFQYCTWEQYTKYKNPDYVSDMIEFFDLAAKYPCIEYLTKSGLRSIVDAKLYRSPTYGAIYWRGNTLQKVLRLTKTEVNELRKSGLSFGPRQLRYYQKAKKAGMKVSLSDAFILSDVEDDGFYKQYYQEILQLAPAEKVLKYMLKQLRTDQYKSVTTLLSDWRDYQKQCKKLGMDLKQERYLFPNNLHEAHKKTTKRIKFKSDKALNIKIAERSKMLESFRFEYKGLFLRPAASSIELFEEGKALEHCIGDYAQSYAQGFKEIYFVRRINEPDKSFFTMSVIGNLVSQCRGFDNCDMTPEIRKFVDMFTKKKLKTRKQTRFQVTGISNENRQEAVV